MTDNSTPSDAEPADDLVTSRHTLQTPSGEISYTVSAGRVVLREEAHGADGSFEGYRPRAELFIAAYVRDHAESAARPVTFAFNGGPGSSSIWLHMGLLGPRRVLMGDAGDLLPPPYGIADNPETLLADSDLVFIDPVSTGFSRVLEGAQPGEYHGYARDLDAVGEVIRLWTSRNDRWMSPKYLAGESYGTLRAAALAEHLESRYGLFLNGIMLISSVIDMGTIRFTEGNDLPYTTYLPTYACLARYHGATPDRPLETVRAEAEEFAARDYAYALAQGTRLPQAERESVITRLAGLTGLSSEYIDRAELRIEHHRFFRELLRDRGQTIGRLDGRFTGWEADDAGERGTYDPSYAAIHGPYAAAWGHYVRGELRYRNDLPYEILTSRVQPWSYREYEGRHVNVSAKLAEAMRHNPHLRIHLGCGYYDGATPYFAAEHAFAHLNLPAALRNRIETAYYEAGHMMYVHEPSRLVQSAQLRRFVTG